MIRCVLLQLINVPPSSRDRYTVLVALQQKLERSPLGRECLLRARELGRQERSWCRTVRPGEVGLEPWPGAALHMLSDANTREDATQGTSWPQPSSFHCFPNPCSNLKTNISLPTTLILFLPANSPCRSVFRSQLKLTQLCFNISSSNK